MFLLLLFGFFLKGELAPVQPGPDFQNIQYLHNISLVYRNETLDGLGAIDSYTDVDAQMSNSLKEAINRALPNYFPSPNVQPSNASLSAISSETKLQQNGLTSQIDRVKRDVDTGVSTSSPATVETSTTQPYGTDEEFYARTDLVHFYVNIDNLEGSGS